MHNFHRNHVGFGLTLLAAFVLFASFNASAQKPMDISANAMGTNQQLGRVVSVDLHIKEYSTAEDKAALMQAFQEKGSEGLANALDKMKSKGRIAITGTLGFDVNFIRLFNMPDGSRKIRFVTDRPITFGEAWSSSRSMDYTLAMGEIIISPSKGKSTGTVYPASKLKLNKDNELEIETYQNPWNLVNIKVW